MKKTNFLKFALTLVMAFVIYGANAQILTDYVQAVAAGPEEIDSVITGTTTRLYVYPDLNFSPTFDPATNGGLAGSQVWEWYPSSDGSGVAIKGAANENWLEYTWGAAGLFPVSVIESNSLLSCDGSVSTIDVRILPEPTVAFTSVDGTPVFGSAASPFSYCESEARLLTDYPQATITSNISGMPSYQIQYSLVVDTTHSGGATWTAIPASGLTYDGAAGTQQIVTGSTHNLNRPVAGFIAIDGRPTRYTYSLNGVTDRITRKCDYLTNSAKAANAWTWYDDVTPETMVILVNPAPVTGPIYHISNMWAN
ncbi:MAG: hypothetical protein AB7S50_14670 [Bacteroidales bacterium]|jgi:hypothetical protein